MSETGDELEKLAALRDSGVLTAEEFAEQKAKLLGESVPPAAAAKPVLAPVAEPHTSARPAAEPMFEASASGFSPKMLGIGAVAVVGAVVAVSAMSGGHHAAPSYIASSGSSAAPDSGAPAAAPADGTAQTADAPASHDGAPSEDDVKRAVVAAHGGQAESYRFNSVQISPAQPITPVQQMSYEAPAGGTWYLVRVNYAWNTSGGDWNNPQTYIHDVIASYAMFHSAMGEWTVSGDAQPGDKDILRGGYAGQ